MKSPSLAWNVLRTLSKVGFLILALLLHSSLCNTAIAQVTLYSTFGPGHSYDIGGGYPVASPDHGPPCSCPGGAQVAAAFTAPFKARLTGIELAVGYNPLLGTLTDQVQVELHSDLKGHPGALLESWLVTGLSPAPSVITVAPKPISVVPTTEIKLQGSKIYWIVLSAGPLAPGMNDVLDIWSWTSLLEPIYGGPLSGHVLWSFDGESTWIDEGGDQTPSADYLPAFEVRGKLLGVKTPLVPIIPSQIVRLTIVAGPITPPPGVPVEAVLGFLGPDGNPIGPSSQVSLNPGQTASLDLNANALPALAQLGRMEILPVVAPPAGSVGFNGEIRSSVEVFDVATGFGSVFVVGSETLPEAPIFAPQALASGQNMRLNVFSVDSTPCVATLGFLDSNGTPIGPTMPVTLSGGQSASLDLNSASLGIPSGAPGRIELQPQVTLGSANGSSVACPASVEVFDNSTGRTRTYQSGSAPLVLPTAP
jgi:hypothetical protein